MLALPVALLVQAVPIPDPASSGTSWRWAVTHRPLGAYVVEDTTGRPVDPGGATATLRATSGAVALPNGHVTLAGALRADTARGRLVRLSAELRTRSAIRAWLWLRVDSGLRRWAITNTWDDAMQGTTGWARREVVLPVTADAQQVTFGVQLVGGGEVSVRHLRVEVLAPVRADAPPAPPARATLDSAISLARRHSIWRDTVSWDVVVPEVRAFAAGAQTPRDVYPALRLLASRLGDRHSFLMEPRAAAAQREGRVENAQPIIRALPGRVGYVLVPGYAGVNLDSVRAYVQRAHDVLLTVALGVRCGWVVDLRDNTGGNMWPMLAALRPFLGDGIVGTFDGPGAADRTPWTAAALGVSSPAPLAPLEREFVAVLTGARTASAGEAVAVAFRGRPRTRSFGVATAGQSTANRMFDLPGGAKLLLTVATYADRTGGRYGGAIAPDEYHPGHEGVGRDDALEHAQEWLARSTACAPRP